MADDLNVILKAMLDISQSKKDIAVLLNTINNDPSLNKVKLGVDFDSSQLKSAVVETRKLFDVVEGQLKIKKEVETVQNSIGKLTKNITEFNKEGIKYSEEQITKQKEQNKYREKAIQLEKELAISSEKFTYKNVGDIYKYGGNIDTSEILNIREQFGKLSINKDGSNIEDITNQVKLLNKQYDLIIDKAKLQKTVNDDLVKQEEEKYKEAKKFAELYKNIKTTLDGLPSRAIGDESKDFYTRLDSSLDSDQLKTLQDETEAYYKKAIALEKEYNQAVKENNRDSIKLYDEKLNKLKFITSQTSQLAKLENDIKNLQDVKGLDGNDYLKQIDNIRSQLSVIDQSDISLIKEEKYAIESSVKALKESVVQNKANLDVENKRKTLITEIESNLQKLSDIQKQYNVTDTSKIDETRESLTKLKTAVENHEKAIDSATIENKQFTNSIKDITSEAKKSSDATSKLGDRLKKAFQYFTFYDALQLAKRGFREMVDVIFDLDDALVELQKVSNLSGDSLESFTRKAYALGAEISKSGSSILKASAEFARAGFADEELLNLAEASLKLTSIGDGLTNVTDSATTLIAVMRGYGKDTSEVTSIMDAINNTSNNAAVSFSQLSEALTRMSGTMSASNVEFHQAIGMFTAINEVLQNMEMSSTALNSLSMRMRGLSEDGEAVDGLSAKLGKMYKEIAGIDLMDTNGQIKSLFEITSELAPVWNTLSENQKQYIAQESAGLRQAKAFLVMMNNYDRVLEATSLAYNSAGSSAKEFARWQESLEGRLNLLRSALEQFSSETINSNFVKSVLDATTAIVNMGTAMGGAIPTVLALSGAFATFKLITFAGGISQIATAIGVLGLSIGAILPALGIATGVGIVIAGIATAITQVQKSAENAKAEVEAFSNELSELQNQNKNVQSLGERYIELKWKKDDKTAEEFEEFYDIQNKLHEILPELNGYYNEQGNYILKNVSAVSDLTSVYKDYIDEKRKERAEASKESSKYTLEQYDKEKKKLEELTEYYKLKNEYLSGNLAEENRGRYSQLGFKYGGISDLEEEIKALTATVQGLSDDLSSEIMNIVKGTDEWSKLTEDEMNAINKAFAGVSKDSLPLLNEAINNGELSIEEFIKILLNTPEALAYLEESVKGSNNEIKELDDTITELSDTLSEFANKQSIFKSIKDELAETNSLSLDNIQELIKAFPELEGVLLNYLTGLASTTDVLNELNKAYDSDVINYKNAIIAKQSTNEEFYNNTANLGGKLVKAFSDSYGIDLSNCKNLAEAKIKVEQETIKAIATLWNKYYDSQKQDFNSAFYNKMPEEYDTRASRELSNTLFAYKGLLDDRTKMKAYLFQFLIRL